jgi:hypothetical protein
MEIVAAIFAIAIALTKFVDDFYLDNEISKNISDSISSILIKLYLLIDESKIMKESTELIKINRKYGLISLSISASLIFICTKLLSFNYENDFFYFSVYPLTIIIAASFISSFFGKEEVGKNLETQELITLNIIFIFSVTSKIIIEIYNDLMKDLSLYHLMNLISITIVMSVSPAFVGAVHLMLLNLMKVIIRLLVKIIEAAMSKNTTPIIYLLALGSLINAIIEHMSKLK